MLGARWSLFVVGGSLCVVCCLLFLRSCWLFVFCLAVGIVGLLCLLLFDCVLFYCVLFDCVLFDCVLFDCVLFACVLFACELFDCVLFDCVLFDCALSVVRCSLFVVFCLSCLKRLFLLFAALRLVLCLLLVSCPSLWFLVCCLLCGVSCGVVFVSCSSCVVRRMLVVGG